MGKRILLWATKLIGVGLFIWMVTQLDQERILRSFSTANWWLLTAAFLLLYVIYFFKTWRWHQLIHATGSKVPFMYTWKVCNLGVFFASVTPGKLGELGRAAYLEQSGMKRLLAIALSIVDRLADIVVIAMLAVGAVGILFGIPPLLLALLGVVLGLWFCGWLLTRQFVIRFLPFLPYFQKTTVVWRTLGITLLSWLTYYAQTTLIARAIGIDIPIIDLAAVLTIAGIVAIIPIAPSGLGTRDATLVLLLGLYGVSGEQAIALGVLMFLGILLSGILGLLYWVIGVKPVHYSHDQIVDTRASGGTLGQES